MVGLRHSSLSKEKITTMKKSLKIATRQSPLALWQAHYIQQRLTQIYPQLSVELVPMVTKGDIILDTPLAKIGGKGLFVKELEQALLNHTADIAVHSMKDVPMEFPEGLGLAIICPREDPRDAFVSNQYKNLEELPLDAIVGTSSLRRQCQLKELRPDLDIRSLRGNVGTRLSKLDNGDYDAIILAAAGLIRLDMQERITSFIEPTTILPAAGQGAVGVECRIDDVEVLELLAPLADEATTLRVTAERAMNRHLQGGCQVPIGGFAILENNKLTLNALVGELDGSKIIKAKKQIQLSDTENSIQEANNLGITIAKELLQQGADRILAELALNPIEK